MPNVIIFFIISFRPAGAASLGSSESLPVALSEYILDGRARQVGNFATPERGILPKPYGVPPSGGQGFSLELFERGVIFFPCQSTSFIAKSAEKTAKSSPVPAIGKASSAPNAVRRNSKKSSPFLLPPMQAALPGCRLKAAAAVAVVAVAESRTGNEGRSVKLVK